MKKMFLTLVIAALVAPAFAADDVNRRILDNFTADFKYAKNVTWTTTAQYVKAKFTEMDVQLEAFYTSTGDLIGVSKTVNLETLPAKTAKYILSKYATYKLGDVIEYTSMEDGISYYVAAENDKEKLILQVTPTASVTVFKRTAK